MVKKYYRFVQANNGLFDHNFDHKRIRAHKLSLTISVRISAFERGWCIAGDTVAISLRALLPTVVALLPTAVACVAGVVFGTISVACLTLFNLSSLSESESLSCFHFRNEGVEFVCVGVGGGQNISHRNRFLEKLFAYFVFVVEGRQAGVCVEFVVLKRFMTNSSKCLRMKNIPYYFLAPDTRLFLVGNLLSWMITQQPS